MSGSLNKSDVLADLFDGLFLALIEDDLVLFEQVTTLGVNGDDQGAELVDVAVPQSFRHTEVTPLGLDDLLHLGGSHNGVTGGEDTVDGTELLAGALGVGTHAALAHDDADTGLLHELILELFHTHGGSGADRHHLEFVVLQRADDGAGVEDGSVLDVHRQRAALFHEAAVCHIAAGGQVAVQVNDITDMDVLQVLCGDRSGKNFLSVFHRQHYKVTPE